MQKVYDNKPVDNTHLGPKTEATQHYSHSHEQENSAKIPRVIRIKGPIDSARPSASLSLLSIWTLGQLEMADDFARKSFVPHEAQSHLNGNANKQNSRIWGEEKPYVIVEKPMPSLVETVWCALWNGGFDLRLQLPKFLLAFCRTISFYSG